MSFMGHKSYGQAIAMGDYSSIIKWSKIGYVNIPATTETDIWSYGATTAVVPLIATAGTVRVKTNNAGDAATILRGPLTADAGTTTTLVDASENFNAATAVQAGDLVVLDKAGTTPEWGFVTAVTSNTELAIAGGFSSGGTTSSRQYYILDANNATTIGAHAVYIGGLDSSYNQQGEIVLTAGAGPGYTATVKNWYRINEFRVIAFGTNLKSVDYIALADAASATLYYSYITGGFTRARNHQYTVPSGKTLWITQWNCGFGISAATSKNDYCRLYTRAAQYSSPDNGIMFKTEQTSGVEIWYPYSEIILSQNSATIVFDEPTKILQKTTLKVTGYASGAGFVTSVLRGYLTTP